MEWHMETGLVATLIASPDQLIKMHPPRGFVKACEAYPVKSAGNAAGGYEIFVVGEWEV